MCVCVFASFFFSTQIHTDKQNYLYTKREMDTHCDDNKQEIWNFHRCQLSVYVRVFFFYTQLDGFVGFFTSHNCEILMSH